MTEKKKKIRSVPKKDTKHELSKTNTNTIMFNLFLYFKSACINEKSDLYLRKIQISF